MVALLLSAANVIYSRGVRACIPSMHLEIYEKPFLAGTFMKMLKQEGRLQKSQAYGSCCETAADGHAVTGAGLSCRKYWMRQENVEQELQKWMQENECLPGQMPTQAALRQSGASMLATALSTVGTHCVAKALG